MGLHNRWTCVPQSTSPPPTAAKYDYTRSKRAWAVVTASASESSSRPLLSNCSPLRRLHTQSAEPTERPYADRARLCRVVG